MKKLILLFALIALISCEKEPKTNWIVIKVSTITMYQPSYNPRVISNRSDTILVENMTQPEIDMYCSEITSGYWEEIQNKTYHYLTTATYQPQ